MSTTLMVGRHKSPRDGCCFMEAASVLAGERWSDRPRCTHPTLASVARVVNDYSSDTGRASLLPLVPAVIGTASGGSLAAARMALRCLDAALSLSPEESDLEAGRRTASFVLSRSSPPGHRIWLVLDRYGWVDRVYRWTAPGTAAAGLVAVVEHTTDADRDSVLRDLLEGCIADCAQPNRLE